jgi:hypothetical protein
MIVEGFVVLSARQAMRARPFGISLFRRLCRSAPSLATGFRFEYNMDSEEMGC